MGTIPPPTFNGTSKYASDLQQVLARSVAIASLPLQGMQNELNTLTRQQSALSELQTAFASFEGAIQNLGNMAQGSVQASVSNSTLLSATAASNALPGTYTVDVRSLGSSTTTLSMNGLTTVTDPGAQSISSASSFTLTVNGTPHTITTSGGTLNALANAINTSGQPVQATIVNLGTNTSPDYRLAITGTNLAADTIQLNDGAKDLLNTLSTGAPADYRVNGLATDILSNSTQVTLAPGLTVHLLQASPGTPVSITVAQNVAGISNALSSFVNGYNSAVDAINKQHGQNAGALSGQSIVLSLGQALQTVVQYSSGSGTVQSLADLGIKIEYTTGHLTFDATALNGLSTATIQQFLGGVTSGGFLQAANSAVTSMEDPSTGAIQNSLTSIQNAIIHENTVIANETDRINTLETNLQKKLSDADATIAMLQQQVSVMTSLFASFFPNSNSNSNSNGK